MVGFWFQWVGATVVGLVVGFIGSFLAVDTIIGPAGPEAVGIPFAIAFPAVIGVTGALVGAFQWFLMRRHGLSSRAWIGATAAGLLLATLVVVQLPEGTTLPSTLIWGALHALIVGGTVGSLQWLAIRSADAGRRWLWASLGGWLVAGIVGSAVAWYADGGLGMMVIFVLWAAVTAPTMHRLLTAAYRATTPPTGHRGEPKAGDVLTGDGPAVEPYGAADPF